MSFRKLLVAEFVAGGPVPKRFLSATAGVTRLGLLGSDEE